MLIIYLLTNSKLNVTRHVYIPPWYDVDVGPRYTVYLPSEYKLNY